METDRIRPFRRFAKRVTCSTSAFRLNGVGSFFGTLLYNYIIHLNGRIKNFAFHNWWQDCGSAVSLSLMLRMRSRIVSKALVSLVVQYSVATDFVTGHTPMMAVPLPPPPFPLSWRHLGSGGGSGGGGPGGPGGRGATTATALSD